MLPKKKIVKLNFTNKDMQDDFCSCVRANAAFDTIVEFYNRKRKFVCMIELCVNGAILTNWYGEQRVYEFGIGLSKAYEKKTKQFLVDIQEFETERL